MPRYLQKTIFWVLAKSGVFGQKSTMTFILDFWGTMWKVSGNWTAMALLTAGSSSVTKTFGKRLVVSFTYWKTHPYDDYISLSTIA
jgi:hypothetical protein